MDDVKDPMGEQEIGMDISFEKRFGWYVVVNRITDGDITKHTQVYEKNVIEVMNQLVYLVEYDNEQIRLQKKALQRG